MGSILVVACADQGLRMHRGDENHNRTHVDNQNDNHDYADTDFHHIYVVYSDIYGDDVHVD